MFKISQCDICFYLCVVCPYVFTLLTPRLMLQWVWLRLVSLLSYERPLTCPNRPSVRFEALSSAEKCIESLRKYRNLHPSFSKVSIYRLTIYFG